MQQPNDSQAYRAAYATGVHINTLRYHVSRVNAYIATDATSFPEF